MSLKESTSRIQLTANNPQMKFRLQKQKCADSMFNFIL